MKSADRCFTASLPLFDPSLYLCHYPLSLLHPISTQIQREAERQRERAWDQERMEQARALQEEERRGREMERRQRMELDKYNQQLAQEQQQQ